MQIQGLGRFSPVCPEPSTPSACHYYLLHPTVEIHRHDAFTTSSCLDEFLSVSLLASARTRVSAAARRLGRQSTAHRLNHLVPSRIAEPNLVPGWGCKETRAHHVMSMEYVCRYIENSPSTHISHPYKVIRSPRGSRGVCARASSL
jgi:hypothetical protein